MAGDGIIQKEQCNKTDEYKIRTLDIMQFHKCEIYHDGDERGDEHPPLIDTCKESEGKRQSPDCCKEIPSAMLDLPILPIEIAHPRDICKKCG